MKKYAKLSLLLAISLVLAGCANSTPTSSQKYPTDAINMIIVYSAGGPTDVAGRAIANYYSNAFGVEVTVQNVTGAAGSVGTARIAKAKPDGYTIGMTTASAVARVPLIRDVGYQLEDVQPVGTATIGPGLIYVPADSPYQTAKEFFQAAKRNPGTISLGTAGVQSPQGVAAKRMEALYNVKFRVAPIGGDADMMTAVLGGNVDAAFGSTAQVVMSQINAGKVRPLAVSTPERVDFLPDVPTLREIGYEKIVYGNSYFIVAAPAGIPKDVLATLETTLKDALSDPQVVQTIGKQRIPSEFTGGKETKEQMTKARNALRPTYERLSG